MHTSSLFQHWPLLLELGLYTGQSAEEEEKEQSCLIFSCLGRDDFAKKTARCQKKPPRGNAFARLHEILQEKVTRHGVLPCETLKAPRVPRRRARRKNQNTVAQVFK